MTKREQNKKKGDIIRRKSILTLDFKELLKGREKQSPVRLNQKIKGWKQFITDRSGRMSIRCQSKTANSNPPKQCIKRASKGHLVCGFHGGNSANKTKKAIKKKKEIEASLGIYEGKGMALQSELKEVENITPDQLQDTTDELKLSLALLRKYLKNIDDKKIAKNPGQLMYLIGEIARLKKEHYEIKHSKAVSFTKEQMMFLFNKFYLILIESIKDTDLLETISDKIDKVGRQIGQNGFIEIN